MANVLETFYFLFRSDAGELDAGLSESERRARETEDAVRNTDEAAGSLGASFKNVAMQAMGVLAAFVSVGAIIEGVKAATAFNDSLGETAEALEVNVEDLSAWSDAAQASGGSADAFQGTLKGLTAAMAAADTTGKSRLKPFFDELGISMLDAAGKARPVMELLPELAASFEGMSKAQSFGIGQKLGLDQGTIMMLQRGRIGLDEIIARQKELGVTTAEDARIAGDFNDALDDTAHAFRSVFTGIASAILPALTVLNQALQVGAVWIRQNDKLVTGFFMAVAGIVTAYYLPAMYRAAVATTLATLPFIAIGVAVVAAAAAFALLYDDVMTFLEGGDSLTGNLLEWFYGLGIVKTAIGGVTSAFEVMSAVIDSIIKAFEWLISKGGQIGDILGNLQGFASEKLTQAMEFGVNAIQSVSGNPLAAQTSASINASNISNRSQTVNMGGVSVNTQATDAAGIAKGVGQHMGVQMRQAMANFDDGVAG